MARQQADQFGISEALEELGQAFASAPIDSHEDVLAGLGGMDLDDSPVLIIVSALHETALFHAVNDSGRARDGHLQEVSEPAHWDRPMDIEFNEDIQVNEA
jgi:hypothetical protein